MMLSRKNTLLWRALRRRRREQPDPWEMGALAKRIGVDRSMLYRVLAGKGFMPTPAKAKALAEALGVDIKHVPYHNRGSDAAA